MEARARRGIELGRLRPQACASGLAVGGLRERGILPQKHLSLLLGGGLRASSEHGGGTELVAHEVRSPTTTTPSWSLISHFITHL